MTEKEADKLLLKQKKARLKAAGDNGDVGDLVAAGLFAAGAATITGILAHESGYNTGHTKGAKEGYEAGLLQGFLQALWPPSRK
jgi:hypothetical protein